MLDTKCLAAPGAVRRGDAVGTVQRTAAALRAHVRGAAALRAAPLHEELPSTRGVQCVPQRGPAHMPLRQGERTQRLPYTWRSAGSEACWAVCAVWACFKCIHAVLHFVGQAAVLHCLAWRNMKPVMQVEYRALACDAAAPPCGGTCDRCALLRLLY